MRTIPTTKLWTGYTVLYVQKDVEYRDVINTLSGKGIQDIIYLENQNVPIAASRESPEVALSLSGAEKSQYLKKRSLYFFDKAQNYKIYYIQDKYEKEVSEVIQTLREQNILCGANAHSSYPFLSILLCIVFAVLLTFNSQNKLLTGLSMVFPVLLTMSVPFYPVMSCSCLFMYGIFFSLKVWNREGAFNCLIKSRVLPGFAAGALLLVLLTSFKGFILFILVIASVLSVSYLAINIKNLMDSKYRVHFVNIRTASVMPLVGKKSTFCMLLCLASLICILLFAIFSSIIHPSSKYSGTKGIMLPSASGSGSLPDTQDYIEWYWETRTYPYISVNQKRNIKPENGNTIEFTEFVNKDGLIVPEHHSVTFGPDFKKECETSAQNLSYPAIEKMLYSQGKSLHGGYVASSSQTINFLTIILLCIAVCIPVVFYYLTTKKTAKRQRLK